ncbi:TIGR01777 family oxidoreductase [Pasteurellaceae bacterium LIM206]|nr:TIGR01777 family oxidoreductase [Pasteurellaceae bacterium LIM206]
MNIFLTGATGLVGRRLTQVLLAKNHRLTALTRSPEKAKAILPPLVELQNSLTQHRAFDQFDAVINLAGEPIFAKSWTVAQKEKLTRSRVQLTSRLAELINQSENPPHTFISGSATGYYGNRNATMLTEEHPPAESFTGRLCRQWEQAALAARSRVCLLRTGMVWSENGGALAKMLPLYRLGLGGKLGSGRQYWAWIHIDDMVNAILWLLEHPQCQGAFNLTAPRPVQNGDFNRLLGKALCRPACCAVPEPMLKGILGERAAIILDSQNAVPHKLLSQGFTFQFDNAESAILSLLRRK